MDTSLLKFDIEMTEFIHNAVEGTNSDIFSNHESSF
jgi:hypothetical protein